MLRSMCGKLRHDKIINVNTKDNVVISTIVKKMLKIKLNWSGYVEKMLSNFVINRVDHTKSQRDKKVKENLKKTIIKIIKKHVEI